MIGVALMNNQRLKLTLIISLAIFIVTAYVTQVKGSFPFDEAILSWVEGQASSSFHGVMKYISILGSSEVILILTGIIGAILLFKRAWPHFWFFAIVSVGGVFLNLLLKFVFQRERPDGETSYIDVFNYTLEIPSYSFPSGHTMRVTILLLFLIYVTIRFVYSRMVRSFLLTTFVLLIIGVALSRALLEAHYLSDTIAAISVSIAWFNVCQLMLKRYESRRRYSFRIFGR